MSINVIQTVLKILVQDPKGPKEQIVRVIENNSLSKEQLIELAYGAVVNQGYDVCDITEVFCTETNKLI